MCNSADIHLCLLSGWPLRKRMTHQFCSRSCPYSSIRLVHERHLAHLVCPPCQFTRIHFFDQTSALGSRMSKSCRQSFCEVLTTLCRTDIDACRTRGRRTQCDKHIYFRLCIHRVHYSDYDTGPVHVHPAPTAVGSRRRGRPPHNMTTVLSPTAAFTCVHSMSS